MTRLLGAICLATINYSAASAQWTGEASDQTAVAVPRLSVPGASEVALPQPLSPSDAARTRRIFALLDHGSFNDAAREAAKLDDQTLLGSIMADRALRDRHVTAGYVTEWLSQYNDQADAPAMRALARRLTPADAVAEPRRSGAIKIDARTLFSDNRDAEAVAAADMQDSADGLLAGGWSAMRLNRLDTARSMFDRAWHAAPNSVVRASAAYWYARAAQRQLDYPAVISWRRRAAEEPGTFYGIIAARMLAPPRVCMRGDVIAIADVNAIYATPAGKRAFALIQVGQRRRAERELAALWVTSGGQGAMTRAIMLLAQTLGMRDLANDMQASAAVLDRNVNASVPPELHPQGGFVMDASLVYGVVRHESNFQPKAVSRAGARGLMQLMGVTAHSVAPDMAGHYSDPAVNLAIGQRYLLSIADDGSVNQDMIRSLAGYAQGTFGLKRWMDRVRDSGDPLMFLEAIPDRKTRSFVQTTLTYSWEYAAGLHIRAVSLDALANGKAPVLARVNGPAMELCN